MVFLGMCVQEVRSPMGKCGAYVVRISLVLLDIYSELQRHGARYWD
jgi:hypothetical protein